MEKEREGEGEREGGGRRKRTYVTLVMEARPRDAPAGAEGPVGFQINKKFIYSICL